jgi:ABC-type amino acid transport substrate-binding protein
MRSIFVFVTLFIFLLDAAGAEKRISYLVLAETVEPIMIVRDGDPMAGGLMTEIVQLIFEGSDYVVEPMVLPWQRMKDEFRNSDNWIVHGFPESFGSDEQAELSSHPIFPFNHSAVTLKGSRININSLDDLDNRTLILVENFQYAVLDDHLAKSADGESAGRIGVVRAFTPRGTLEMLRHRRGDVVIDWEARIIYNLQSAGLSLDDVEFHDATEIVPTENMHLVFSARQSDEFRDFINARIKSLSENGQLYGLAEKYYKPAKPPTF